MTTWLLKLYPPAWQRRYGPELADLVAAQPFSIGGALDLLGGAIDAWLNPQLIRSTPDTTGGVSMTARLLRLGCAGYGPQVTREDKVRSTVVNIGGTLLLTLVWLALFWSSKREEPGARTYITAAAPMAYLLPYLVGLRYTSLKGRSPLAQAIAIATLSAAVMAILMGAGWISTKV
jgi:hypothetical protein